MAAPLARLWHLLAKNIAFQDAFQINIYKCCFPEGKPVFFEHLPKIAQHPTSWVDAYIRSKVITFAVNAVPSTTFMRLYVNVLLYGR